MHGLKQKKYCTSQLVFMRSVTKQYAQTSRTQGFVRHPHAKETLSTLPVRMKSFASRQALHVMVSEMIYCTTAILDFPISFWILH